MGLVTVIWGNFVNFGTYFFLCNDFRMENENEPVSFVTMQHAPLRSTYFLISHLNKKSS